MTSRISRSSPTTPGFQVGDSGRRLHAAGRRPDGDHAGDGHVHRHASSPIYSIGYMHDDPGYPRFFAEVSLFIFSMTLLVLADNFLLLYAGWEGVGLCSYLLIGFWFEKPSAADAARKAFLVTRIGDVGLLLGIILLWVEFRLRPRLRQVVVRTRLPHGRRRIYVAGRSACCCFCGAVGKSAQFPLHVWLPDAMEGPTPVSALIHAATMVTAGVYLIARCTPLFVLAPEAAARGRPASAASRPCWRR